MLERLLGVLEPTDGVLIMDADTVMAPRFIEIAQGHLGGTRRMRRRGRHESGQVGGVGGLFVGKQGGSRGS